MINVVCDRDSWGEILGRIKETQRFSDPSRYDQELLDKHGPPLLIRVGDMQVGFDIHIYPPGRLKAC